MKLTKYSLIAAIFAVLVAGCSTAPTLPKIETTKGDRVGILVDVGDSPTHTHIGTTVFNNFTKKYPYDWRMAAAVTSAVEKGVKGAGLTPINLRTEGIDYADVAGLVQPAGETWQVAPGKADTMRRLQSQFGIKALFVLKEAPVLAALECFGGPCSERSTDTSGLYTRSFLGITTYYAVAAYKWSVFVFDPLVDVAKADPLRKTLWIPATHLKGFKDPANFENLTEAELLPVRDAVLRFTEATATEAAKSLNAR